MTDDGIYLINYNMLRGIGITPEGIDPHKLQLFAGMNGMLPQSNQSPRVYDLRQVALYEVGLDDGKFNNGDYLLFFAQGPDRVELNVSKGTFLYENNLFTDKNYYFLTIGQSNGLRLTTQPDLPGTFPAVTEYDYFAFYETDQTNLLRSGREWFGERFDVNLEYTVRFNISGIPAGSPIKVMTSLVGSSTGSSSFQIEYNGGLISTQPVPPIPGEPYTEVGYLVRDTLTVNASLVAADSRISQDVKIRYNKAATGASVGYLDYVLIHSKRQLTQEDNVFSFTSLASLQQPTTRYVVNTFTGSDIRVWNVTDPFQPVIQQFQATSGNAISFTANSTTLQKYALFSMSNGPPAYEGEVANQNLRGTGATDLLIISAPEFLSEAERFASHRRDHSGIAVTVVTTDQVYNEFSGGKQDVTALRDFVKYLYDQGTGIRNVMLFGRGSYDYKNYLSYNKNHLPLYQSRNSLHPLQTYASDDYIGFLEDHEGNWREEAPVEAHTLEVGIGRIPVKKLEEATAWVNKVIAYETNNWGSWRKRIVITADDGDGNLHQNYAQQIADSLETYHAETEVRRVFLDDYAQATGPAGQASPEARKALNTQVNNGAGILNFIGHGSEQQWMQERILDQLSLDEWKPGKRYPFLVTATCEFGRHDDPGLISTAELSLFRSNSGSIGMVTTARPVFSSSNFLLNKSFYQSLFKRSNNLIQDWGSVFLLTKNASMSGVQNRNFALLGDPSMLPPLGSAQVVVNNIQNLTSASDTLKALSKIRVEGTVYHQGVPDSQYDGLVQLTLYNKPTSHVTKGDENPPFNYVMRDDALFRGDGSVQSGQFSMEFVVPKNIDPVVNKGVMSLYVSPKSSSRDGMGSRMNVKIGSIESNAGTDVTGPEIELFMGDTTFISGGIIGSSSKIVAILTDDHGIDISNFNPQNDIMARLDDSLTVNLNSYFRADENNYARGKVEYPIIGLIPGSHHLTLTASDTYGNTSTATIVFHVSDQPGIQIEQWLNYPNPFSSSTVFHFKHNRPGDDLEAVVTIFDRTGREVMSSTYQIGSSTYKVDLPPWDGTSADGNKLTGGLYLMKLSVRSMLDGTKNERIAKVILLN